MITSSQCFTLLFNIPVYQCKPGSWFFSFFWSSLPGVSEECNSLVTISQWGQNFLNFLQLQSHLTAVNKERSLLLCLPGRVSILLSSDASLSQYPFCFANLILFLFFFFLSDFIHQGAAKRDGNCIILFVPKQPALCAWQGAAESCARWSLAAVRDRSRSLGVWVVFSPRSQCYLVCQLSWWSPVQKPAVGTIHFWRAVICFFPDTVVSEHGRLRFYICFIEQSRV